MRFTSFRSGSFLQRNAGATVLLCLTSFAAASAESDNNAAAFYVGRISSVNAWHDLITAPGKAEFLDAYVAVAALSQVIDRYHHERLSVEAEGQVVYNFGDQSHWEFNVAAGPRWSEFPWNETIAMTAAFQLGLSLASETPAVEVELEGDSQQLLIYWSAEITLGPPRGAWAVLLRLHHRSSGFGLLADDGGMNALALGVRHTF
jgi:hypothetical protein